MFQYKYENFLIGIGSSSIKRTLIYYSDYGNKIELADEYGEKYRNGIPFRIGLGKDKYFSLLLSDTDHRILLNSTISDLCSGLYCLIKYSPCCSMD